LEILHESAADSDNVLDLEPEVVEFCQTVARILARAHTALSATEASGRRASADSRTPSIQEMGTSENGCRGGTENGKGEKGQETTQQETL